MASPVDSVFRILNALFAGLQPLGSRKNPNWACAIGFFAGGIGLAIYFRSFVDLIVPLALAVAASLLAYKFLGEKAELGWLAGALIASLYGYFRALNSNGRLSLPGGGSPAPPGIP